jgi:ribosomal protein S12 methylthiotransferase
VKIAYVSLGCPKNVSDLESMLGSLAAQAEITEIPSEADATIINTCAFIESAKTEAIDTILNILQIKSENPDHKVIVTGCLPQRYKEEISELLPEVDWFVPFVDAEKATIAVFDFLGKKYEKVASRKRISPNHYGYLKISEGCNNRCSYCAIPLIKGNYKSFPKQMVLEEAHKLVESGVKELIVVAQDTTVYGRDLNQQYLIQHLLNDLNDIPELKWIRLMYTHPARWTDELIETVAGLDKIVKYIDLPIQHISDRMLKKMGRHVNRKQVENLIEKLRLNIPDLALRTSIIVGFPGETQQDFEELHQFIEETKFDRLGTFTYSKEEGTRAYKFEDSVAEHVKTERLEKIMESQAEIACLINEKLVGRNIDVMVDTVEHGHSIGRSQWDAPEVDNSIHVPYELNIGNIVNLEIVDADNYDLYAADTEK